MTTTTEDELWDRLQRTAELPYGPSQIAAREQLIVAADRLGVPLLRYATRLRAVSAYHMGGEPAKAFVPFSWCLSVRDAGEVDDRFDHSLMWAFKWIVASTMKFPQIPLDRTRAVLDDMERRYRLAGHTMGPVHQQRAALAAHLGDRDGASEQLRLWRAAPNGEMSDCAGCEPSDIADLLDRLGQPEEAVAAGHPAVLGELSCASQPQSILTSLLVPYLRLGMLEEAAQAHRRAYRALRTEPGEMAQIADHIGFCTLTNNPARGLELVERHLGELVEPPSPMAEMRFSAAAARVLDAIAEAQPGTTVRRDGTDVPVTDLRDELTARARGVAAAFDERNGTAQQSADVEAMLVAEPVVDGLPLSGPVRRAPAPQAVAAPEPLPATAAELAALADHYWSIGEPALMLEAWERFDEVCPEPEGLLLAQWLQYRSMHADDPQTVEAMMRKSAMTYLAEGQDEEAQRVLGRLATAICAQGRPDEAIAMARESAERLTAMGAPGARLPLARVLAQTGDREGARREIAAALADPAATGRWVAGVHEFEAQLLLADPESDADPQPDMEAALRSAERALAGFRAAGATGRVRDVLRMIASVRTEQEGPAAGYAVMQTVELPADPAERGLIQESRGELALQLGEPETAMGHFVAAVADLTAGGLTGHASYTKVELALAALQSGAFADSADAAEEAVAELDGYGDTGEAARARNLLAHACNELREHGQALLHHEAVAEHCAAGDLHHGLGSAREAQAEILDGLDRDAEAAVRFTEAADAFDAAGEPLRAVQNRRLSALSWNWAGDIELAAAVLAIADARAAALDGDEPAVAWQRALLAYDGARILAHSGATQEAIVRVAPAAAVFRSLGHEDAVAAATTLHGRLLIDAGRADEARPILEAALAAIPPDETERRQQIEELLRAT
ncbi:hypothetical protein WEH80_20255 [Actinomycetes bacterium KLBMP 9759]